MLTCIHCCLSIYKEITCTNNDELKSSEISPTSHFGAECFKIIDTWYTEHDGEDIVKKFSDTKLRSLVWYEMGMGIALVQALSTERNAYAHEVRRACNCIINDNAASDFGVPEDEFLCALFQSSNTILEDEEAFFIVRPIFAFMSVYKHAACRRKDDAEKKNGSSKKNSGKGGSKKISLKDKEGNLTLSALKALHDQPILSCLKLNEIAFILLCVRKLVVRRCKTCLRLKAVLSSSAAGYPVPPDDRIDAMIELHNKDGLRTEEITLVRDTRQKVRAVQEG
ncbi:MAG: hypothetical protein ACREOZ_04170 [Gloeomargaritales cyanobacterium]